MEELEQVLSRCDEASVDEAAVWVPPSPPADHPDTVILAPKEALGIVVRSLQSAEWPMGAVSAAAAAVGFRQTLLGDGLQRFWELVDNGEDVHAGEFAVVAEGRGWAMVDGSRVSSLLVGPGCFDLAYAEAQRGMVGSVYLSGAIHDGFLPGLAAGVAGRGMVCLATVRSSGHGDDAHQWYLAAPSHEGWVLSMGRVGDPRAGVTFASADDLDSRHRNLSRLWKEGLVTADGVPVGWDVLRDLASIDHPAELLTTPHASVVVVAVQPGAGWRGHHAEALTSQIAPDGTTTDSSAFRKKYKAEISDGIELGWDEWWQFLDYADRTLVPTSEESRRGTGSMGDPGIDALE